MHFTKQSRIRAPAERVFAFHERPDAFALLQPPWQTTVIDQPPASLEVGTRVVLRVKVGPLPLWQRIVAEHVAYEPGVMFADRMVEGPFRRWYHEHRVIPIDSGASWLVDDIDFELPLGLPGRIFGGPFARHELERMFEHRHAVTRRICEGAA